MGFIIGMDLFFWLAVFVLRRNIMAEKPFDVVTGGKCEVLTT